MPWTEVSPMQERMRFVIEAELTCCSFSELCRRYGISRKTGYKWLNRYKSGGIQAMVEHQRRPKTSPTQVDPQIAARVLELRRRHPRWGPKKLVRLLADEGIDPPAASTIGGILKRAGLTRAKRGRVKQCAPGQRPSRNHSVRITSGRSISKAGSAV